MNVSIILKKISHWVVHRMTCLRKDSSYPFPTICNQRIKIHICGIVCYAPEYTSLLPKNELRVVWLGQSSSSRGYHLLHANKPLKNIHVLNFYSISVIPFRWWRETNLKQYMTCNFFKKSKWRIQASVTYAIVGSENGLSPVRRRAIIYTNAGLLLVLNHHE